MLSGDNSYSGGTTVQDGTLSLQSDTAAGIGTITTTGSVIDYGNGVTIANAIDVDSNSTQLQVLAGTATQSGDITETGFARPVEKIGGGTLVLSGTNTFTGTTAITAGTLRLVNGAAVSDSSNVVIFGSSRLDLADGETVGSLTGVASSTVTLNGNTLITGASNVTTEFSGEISGSGGVTKTGAGAFTLSGTNSFTGPLTINQGFVVADGGTAIADSVSLRVNGGTFQANDSETIGSLAAPAPSGSQAARASPRGLTTARQHSPARSRTPAATAAVSSRSAMVR
ncbi:autotransporter-associated beta strand repeat-containing protein [Methyloligella halotolerans]|uniref:autotransporter-associated beta strand repeat-containing protein n=1 Tax=Methyloligella halotolerans TaxID=1177755 RepID=UPI001471C220|nr:autotransporter-associated beta strand repeat-containing protein [Methyloligella halotolerans]